MSNSSKPSLEAGGTVDSDSEYNDAKKYPSGAFIDTGLRIGAAYLSDGRDSNVTSTSFHKATAKSIIIIILFPFQVH